MILTDILLIIIIILLIAIWTQGSNIWAEGKWWIERKRRK